MTGIMCALLGAGAAAAPSWTLVAAVGGNDVTSVTLPAGLQTGDIGILFDTCTQTSSITGVIPTNWTSLYNVQTAIGSTGSQHRSCLSYRLLNSALSSTTVTGINASAGSVGKVLLVIRPSFSPVSVANNGVSVGSTTPPTYPSSLTINPDASAALSFRFGYWRCSNTSAVTGNSLSPAPAQSYDLKVDFGGTNIGDGAWQMAFDINPGPSAPTSTVVYGSNSPQGTYSLMLAGSFNIN